MIGSELVLALYLLRWEECKSFWPLKEKTDVRLIVFGNSGRLTDNYSVIIAYLWCILNHLYRLSAPPETLDQLGDSLALLEQLQQDLPNIEAKFPPLHQQFAILEKYEVAIPEEVR